MRERGLLAFSLVCLPAMMLSSAEANLNPAPAAGSRLPAMEILARVRANLPKENLVVKGQILSGDRIGKLQRIGYIDMFLGLGGNPATVRYRISDTFGAPVEQMTIRMAEGCEAEFEYEKGNPLRPAAAPPPTSVIRNTDVTWNDLALLFLWRTEGRILREETLRGRECHILAFPRREGGTIMSWIDMEIMTLLQMEELGGDGALQRRMIIKSMKKISDQWMIKDLELRSYPSRHHTLIRVDAISPQSAVNGQ